MAQRIAEFTALMDRSRCRRGDVAGDATWKGELGEQLLHTGFVLCDTRVDVAPAAFEVGVGDQGRSAVPRTGDVEHVKIELLDDPVQVYIDEVLARRRTPMPDHKGFDVGKLEWLAQQRIVVEVDLPNRQVIGGAPVGIHSPQFV